MGTNDLLRTLSSTILPPGVERRSGQSKPLPVQAQSFAELLAGKSAGSVLGGRGVTVRPEASVNLSPDQMARLGDAIDRAESAGAQHALVMIDGMALKVDVGVRQVVAQVDLQKSPPLTGIDTVLHAGDHSGSAQKATLPGTGFHPNLAKILQGPAANAA